MKPDSLVEILTKKEEAGEYMKRALFLAILGSLVVLIACTNTQSANDVPRISKDELKAKLGSPDVVLLDVRAKKDWEGSNEKITGAVRMDPQTVDTWAGTLPKDKEIILYCA
jgi:3-mercaptopyruvate sulfurtransferase SseA